MNSLSCERVRESFPELLDPRTPAAALGEVREHLANCPACQREFAMLHRTLETLDGLPIGAPSPALRRDFYAMLEEEKHSATSARANAERDFRNRSRRIWRWVLAPAAAAALLLGGFLAGTRYSPAPAPAPIASDETARELRQLKNKVDRLDAMNQLVASALRDEQTQPASERLAGVMTSASVANPGNRVVDELITSLALDPSANVRLRALEALYPLAGRDAVRAGVLASLPRETNPLVQVAMIDFLAAARDREAKPALERMSVNALADQDVRAAAKRALAQL
ncbi:MAG TPA: HEAT repeat domain-containing protein [Opitutaceae bacterium]|nr:HEAT repeat domain-containing protein [Opitutaceae bacterium]